MHVRQPESLPEPATGRAPVTVLAGTVTICTRIAIILAGNVLFLAGNVLSPLVLTLCVCALGSPRRTAGGGGLLGIV